MDGFTLTVTGDTILNHRISDVADARFTELAAIMQNSTVTVTHFESLIHDYDGPEVYPAAEAGWTWMRSPASVTDDLRWLGVDAVSLASNHAGDYSVGGLRNTWQVLDAAGIPNAGAGEELDAARAPAYFWKSGRKFALLSMSTSVPRSAVAAPPRDTVRGRPGVNPLRFRHRVDSATMARISELARDLGLWCEESRPGTWLVHPPGLHNSGTWYEVADVAGAALVADPADRAGNLDAVRDAAARSDVTVVHVHTHEWDPGSSLEEPPDFVAEFARDCVRAGARVVVAEGSHAPFRGVELVEGGVIFYDPGELFMHSRHVTHLPHEFFERQGVPAQGRASDALAARVVLGDRIISPPGGYRAGPVDGGYLATVRFAADATVEGVDLVPYHRERLPGEYGDVPRVADPDTGARILERVDQLSRRFGTRVRVSGGRGAVEPDTENDGS